MDETLVGSDISEPVEGDGGVSDLSLWLLLLGDSEGMMAMF